MSASRCVQAIAWLRPTAILLSGLGAWTWWPTAPLPIASAEPPAAEVESTAPAEPSEPPTAEEVDGWIEQLADDAYAVRQLAADRLLGAGEAARGPLLAVADGPDPEVRAAARRLLALIDENQFQRRLAAFAADTDGRLGLTLPGWDEFRELIGGDAPARALFVEMQRSEGPLLDEVFSEQPRDEPPLWEQRLPRLLNWRARPRQRAAAPPLGSCATMLLVGSLDEPAVSDQAAHHLVQLMQRPPLRDAFGASPEDPTRRLMVAWIAHCPNENQSVLQQRLNLAAKHDLADIVPLALAVAHGDPKYLTATPSNRVLAILVVGQLGEPEHAAKLEPLLEDTTVVVSDRRSVNVAPNRLPDVQMRDIALAVILHMNRQDLKDYGFEHARRHPTRLFDPKTLGMESDEVRSRALAKWQQWKTSHQD